MGKIGFLKPIS